MDNLQIWPCWPPQGIIYDGPTVFFLHGVWGGVGRSHRTSVKQKLQVEFLPTSLYVLQFASICLKGACHQIFILPFFIFHPDPGLSIFELVSISSRYSIIKFENSDSPKRMTPRSQSLRLSTVNIHFILQIFSCEIDVLCVYPQKDFS